MIQQPQQGCLIGRRGSADLGKGQGRQGRRRGRADANRDQRPGRQALANSLVAKDGGAARRKEQGCIQALAFQKRDGLVWQVQRHDGIENFFPHRITLGAQPPRQSCLAAMDMQQGAGLGADFLHHHLGQAVGIAVGIAHQDETGCLGLPRRLRADGIDGHVAAGRAADKRANAIGAGEQQRLHAVQRHRRPVMELGVQERRDHGLVAACRQFAGNCFCIFLGPGDQDFHAPFVFLQPPRKHDRGAAVQSDFAVKSLTVLGIETSCDETAAAVVRGTVPGPGEILSNVVFSQDAAHAPYGGVVPEIASRAHLEILDDIVQKALDQAGIALSALDAVAGTAGPGLIGGVMVGLTTAKALAMAAGKPLIAVNHLAGHALTARLTDGVAFPYLLLLVSGGHCQLLAVEGPETFRLYGSTMDDAAGEAFDKTAKLLGLPYPGGPQVEAHAARGNPRAYALPRPLLGRAKSSDNSADFSFSGLKTAVRQLVAEKSVKLDDACASFQAAVIDILRDRTRAAMAMFRRDFPQALPALVVSGGVAANQAIGTALGKLAEDEDFQIRVPPPRLCTDNGAMIAWAGLEKLAAGASDPLAVGPRARWPLHMRV